VDDEVTPAEAEWTVRDADGVDHRALRQSAGTSTWVITACPWWLTHNVAGQKAPVRVDCVPTCLECVMLEIQALGKPRCVHCGNGRDLHNLHMHSFEAA
jgi:hypothetical protein